MNEQIILSTEKSSEAIRYPDGTGTLIYTQTLPKINGRKRFNEFYNTIGRKCASFCRTVLIGRCKAYAGNTDRWELTYRLLCRAHVNESRITAELCVTLCNKTTQKLIFRHTEEHLWSKSAERMLPIKNKNKKLDKNEKFIKNI